MKASLLASREQEAIEAGDHLVVEARSRQPLSRGTPTAIQSLATTLIASVPFCMAPVSGGDLSLPWQETQRIQGGDITPSDNFGNSVALDGDRALIGNRLDFSGPGSAYVFRHEGQEWQEEQKLTASDGMMDDRFGVSVGLDGDTAVVGAYLAEINGNAHQGAAYVYEKIGGAWVETQKLTASDGQKQDSFGSAVAVEEDTIMVSAPSADIAGNLGQGAVYVFDRVAGDWIEQQKIVIFNGQPNDLLGQYNIGVDGSRAVVGTPSATVDGINNKGAAYVLRKEGGIWVEEARLTPAGAMDPIGFGYSVDLHGSRVVAGATGDAVTHEAQGTAYIFTRIGDSWAEGQRLVASDASEFAFFGMAVATEGGRVLVGGTFDTPGNPSRGAVYSFRWEGAAWIEEQKVIPSDSSGLDDFGEAIALDLDRLLVGGSGSAGGGAAYLFQRSPLFADDFESGNTSAWSHTVP